uniref:Mex-3 RNA binding family member D n=1 Tax=Cyprinus carpio carpio TaxID=630221 RepID=A0A9J8BH72_CYPCA
MPSPLFHPDIMDHEMVVSSTGQSGGVTEQEPRGEDHQEALRFALDQLSLMALEKVDCLDGTSVGENCNGGGGYVDLQLLEHTNGSRESPGSCSPSPEYYGSGGGGGYHMAGPHSSILAEQSSVLRKRSVNMTECVPVPTSEHVAEIVGRQGCKIKALRAKTNTYIKTPVRGEEPVFIVTGRREDVEMAKREIISAAEHFSMIRASRCKAGANGPGSSGSLPGPPNLPGQTTIQVRVPYRVVGLVVGPKGATIKRIQQQTHTYIVTPSREKDPVFEVTGMPENVDRAREEIETHITLRTGAFVDLQTENDFHNNGTDMSSESFSATRRAADGGGSPTSPFSTSSAGGSFSFAGDSTPNLPATSEDLGFEFGAANIWAPFLNGAKQPGLSGGAVTPRLSPDPDHPLARRAQSDPLSALSWLQTGGGSSGGSSTGYSSCSASSLPGGSPTDSEGGGSGGGIASTMLGRLKAGGLAGMVSRDCFVCCESEVTAALVPCGHNLFCMDCAGQICQSQDPECPVCHTPATQCIRIFS